MLGSDDARSHAVAVLRDVREAHVAEIAEAVESGFETFRKCLPPDSDSGRGALL